MTVGGELRTQETNSVGTVAAPSFCGAVLLYNLCAYQGIHHDGESTRSEEDLATQPASESAGSNRH